MSLKAYATFKINQYVYLRVLMHVILKHHIYFIIHNDCKVWSRMNTTLTYHLTFQIKVYSEIIIFTKLVKIKIMSEQLFDIIISPGWVYNVRNWSDIAELSHVCRYSLKI